MNLAALLFDGARRLPEQPAVSDDRNSWSYRELTERIARLAGGFRARGLMPGDRVLLSLENCGEFFELLFGCWAAGLCAVPANARLHPREVEYIAENSGARLLAASPNLAEALTPLATSVGSLDEVISTRSGEYEALFKAETLLPEHHDPADRAWLFYTSGTTGRPKGAVLTHRNLLFMSQCYYADIDHLDERDTHLLAAPVSARRGPLRAALSAEGRAPNRAAAFRRAGNPKHDPAPSARVDVRRADNADPACACARGGRHRSCQSAHDLLRRWADVCRRSGKGARPVRPAALPVVRPGRVADDDHRPEPAAACR
jgi:hypothetical protein